MVTARQGLQTERVMSCVCRRMATPIGRQSQGAQSTYVSVAMPQWLRGQSVEHCPQSAVIELRPYNIYGIAKHRTDQTMPKPSNARPVTTTMQPRQIVKALSPHHHASFPLGLSYLCSTCRYDGCVCHT